MTPLADEMPGGSQYRRRVEEEEAETLKFSGALVGTAETWDNVYTVSQYVCICGYHLDKW